MRKNLQACVYARFLCVQAGVKFVLGEPEGKLETLIVKNNALEKKITGIRTCDGKSHFGDLVIVACKNVIATYELVHPVLMCI
jgi:sarcosine oxidase / L-pipecolate oxidase